MKQWEETMQKYRSIVENSIETKHQMKKEWKDEEATTKQDGVRR